MSLLTIVRDACARLGGIAGSPPSAVVASNDEAIALMLSLANQEGKELAGRIAWQKLTREVSFFTLAQEVQTGVIPAAAAWLLPGTMWNRTRREMVYGPVDAADWQALRASQVGPTTYRWRQRGGDLLFIPNPVAGEQIHFEYVTSMWVDVDGDGVPDAAAFQADGNVPVIASTQALTEELMTLALVWRWRMVKGLEYAGHFQTYKVLVDQAISRDGGRPAVLDMYGGGYSDAAVRVPGVPEGSWAL